MGVLHMPTAAGHHPLKSCPRHEAPPQIILKSVTFTMTTDSPSRAPPQTTRRDETCRREVSGTASEIENSTFVRSNERARNARRNE